MGLARDRSGGQRTLPEGLHRLPGPCVIGAVRYTDSPVGPYLELAVGEPARLGARPGVCMTTMVVNTPHARAGGRVNWGYPKELGTLRWSAHDDDRELAWEERGLRVRGRPRRFALPVMVPVRNLQRRGDGPVVVPARVRGRARFGRLEVDVPDGDPLAGIAGSHPGAVVSAMRFVLDPARLPSGVLSTLLAPLSSPEPALSSSPSGD